MYRIGIDVGGTFTDLVKCGEEHERQAAVEVKRRRKEDEDPEYGGPPGIDQLPARCL